MIYDFIPMMTMKQAKQSKGSKNGNYECIYCNMDKHTPRNNVTKL